MAPTVSQLAFKFLGIAFKTFDDLTLPLILKSCLPHSPTLTHSFAGAAVAEPTPSLHMSLLPPASTSELCSALPPLGSPPPPQPPHRMLTLVCAKACLSLRSIHLFPEPLPPGSLRVRPLWRHRDGVSAWKAEGLSIAE